MSPKHMHRAVCRSAGPHFRIYIYITYTSVDQPFCSFISYTAATFLAGHDPRAFLLRTFHLPPVTILSLNQHCLHCRLLLVCTGTYFSVTVIIR